jgi:5-methyltetrahydrofolate--homocysteine methyltransferase
MKAASLREALAAREFLLSDGAMGTGLMEKGLEPGACPEELNLSHPDWVREISSAYREAGADILQTNTFGASPLKLASYDLDMRTEEINQAAVRIAREAAGGRALVAGDCGPCGRLLEPYGDATAEMVRSSFRRQIGALSEAGADLILVETMTDLHEALLAVEAAKENAPSLPVAVTLTFDRTPRGFFTMMGQAVAQAARELERAGADAVGSNCGNGIEAMTAIAREFRAATRLPVMIQSNAGLPEYREGRIHYPESPEFFALHAPFLLQAGVSILGGCCGTTPEHIRALRQVVTIPRSPE